jgi:hypothetical protein
MEKAEQSKIRLADSMKGALQKLNWIKLRLKKASTGQSFN